MRRLRFVVMPRVVAALYVVPWSASARVFSWALPLLYMLLCIRTSAKLAPSLQERLRWDTAIRARTRPCTVSNSYHAGTMATLAFSPRYAAPEVLQAFEAKAKEVHVDSAIDIWALGVMAYEVRTACVSLVP